MKRLCLIISCAAVITVFTAPVPAQILKPIDHNKLADDVSSKNLQFGSAEFNTIKMDTRETARSSVSDKTAVLKGNVGLNKLELQTLNLDNIIKTNLQFKNFTAKRAAITDKARSDKDLSDVQQAKAPIAKRQIRPFAPGGEEELKKQLNTPPQ
jgi:hypothetical protein